MSERPAKAHRAPQSGRSADKKKDAKDKGPKKQGFNEKAFAPTSGRNANLQGRRRAEKDQTRLHVPLVNRTPEEEPPPVVIALVGPPGVGKSTLLKSLVKRFTKHNLGEVRGPVTVVSGKTRRLTFIECANDLNAMIDIAKVADLVLLMIDGSFGFEMETFEFLNILQAHGFPKVIGVLTHLDLIKKTATLRTQKKTLKTRFWKEIYQGAKLFYLSGVMNGRYPDTEIMNLSRFISVMKFRPLVFRNTHPYLLADRLQDLTPPHLIAADPKTDRTITLYGYLRGTNLPASGARVHIPGAGDLTVSSIEKLKDPCPLPTIEGEKRRKMGEKGKLIHAPMSDVGGVMFDKDAVYVNVMGSFTRRKEGEELEEGRQNVFQGEGERMVMDLQDVSDTLGDRIANSNIRLLGSSSAPLTVGERERRSAGGGVADLDEDEDDDEMDEDDDSEQGDYSEEDGDEDSDEFDDEEDVPRASSSKMVNTGRTTGRVRPQLPSSHVSSKKKANDDDESDSDSDVDLAGARGFVQDGAAPLDLDDDSDDDGEEDVPRWKSALADRAREDYEGRVKSKPRNLMKLIYASDLTPEEIIAGETVASVAEAKANGKGDDFFQVKGKKAIGEEEEGDQIKSQIDLAALAIWDEVGMLDSIRSLFITGETEGADGEGAGDEPYEDENGGDFEDLEGGGGEDDFNGIQDDEEAEVDADGQAIEPIRKKVDYATSREAALATKKAALKRKFDEQYDGSDEEDKLDFYDEKKEEMAKQLQLNREEFAGVDDETRALVEGYRPGAYVRIELSSVPCEMVENFDPTFPIIVGGILPAEERFGFLTVRIKRHRWHVKILKTNDPLIFSLGWRRFQSLPIYHLDDHSIRNRLLKYTPEHMHCAATFYGPVSLPNTGFCAFNTLDSSRPGFRVSATGVVLDVDRSTKIVKKLKLTGVPYKIFKNTAFIKDMFNSALEVAKFEGASIKTVSGIRGQIKKALAKPDGAFRAAFEDKILMSDIVFLRAWLSVEPRKYYNPVTSLLLADKTSWEGMRLTGRVRHENSLKTPLKVNSTYKPVERTTRRFNPLKVPRALQASLPYASKTKAMLPQKRETYMQKRAVVMSSEEKKATALLQQIQSLRTEKTERRKGKQEERKEKHRKEQREVGERKEEWVKGERKKLLRNKGVQEKSASMGRHGAGGGGKKQKRD